MRISARHLAAIAIVISVALPLLSWAGGSYSTVNKSIRIGSGTAAGDVDSVNGAISIGSDSSVRSVESVNGGIRLREGVVVEYDIEAVNGAIELDRGAEVGGSIETVNGGIELQGTNVAGDVQSYNGSIRLLDGTVVEGNVRVRKSRGWSSKRKKPVKVEIGEDVQVLGDLIFEQAVELRIHASARVGEVIGEEVKVIGG